MAQQSAADRKSQLISQLERSRKELSGSMRGVRHDLNVPSHLKQAFARQKTVWIAGALITGWILSRIPARKKAPKNAPPPRDNRKLKEAERAGLWIGLLSVAGTVFKPAITAFLSRKVTEFVENQPHERSSRRHARR